MTELRTLSVLCADPREPALPVAFEGERQHTRAGLRARACAWATSLRERPGTDWALHSDDGFELLAALFGAWAAGKTVWLPADALPATVAGLRERVSGFAGEFADVECLQAPGPGAAAVEPAPLAAGCRLMVYTSGTSGEPVAIPKTLAQLDAEVRALQALWGERVDRALVVASVPHRHLYGLLFKLLWAVARGAPFVARSLGYPEEVLAWLVRGPAVWVASPSLLKRLPAHLDWAAARAGLRAVFSSGGPLEAAAAQNARVLLGAGVIEVYGSSETGGIATRVQGEQDRWRPLPGVVVSCAGAQATLLVRSPWLHEETAWQTADRASLFADGCFSLLGRIDRIAKVEEKRVSLDAIERALAAHSRVAEARVLQLADGRLGAVVVPRGAGDAALRALLRAALAPAVEPVAIPRRWRFVDALPRDALGKCTHAACAALFGPLRADARAPEILHEEVFPGRHVLQLRVGPGLVWFDGHFPGAAVLPGVVQVHWVIGLASARFVRGARFLGMEQLKFQRLIRPGTLLELELRHDAARGRVEFGYRSAAGAHSSGRILFGD